MTKFSHIINSPNVIVGYTIASSTTAGTISVKVSPNGIEFDEVEPESILDTVIGEFDQERYDKSKDELLEIFDKIEKE